METAPLYSVVITAHNEAKGIGACLASIKNQTGLSPGQLEIILVDDRSTDSTMAVAKAADIPFLRLIEIARLRGHELTARQYALDEGFRAARGEVILTLDADGIAAPDWVTRMAGPILAGKTDAISGAVSFRPRGNRIAQFQTVDVAFYLQVCRFLAALGFEAGVLFGNFAFRAGLYAETGGFSHLGRALTEDLVLARALRRAGKRISYAPGDCVSVDACPSWTHVIERAKRISSGGASALAAVLGVWGLSLPVLIGLALAFGGVIPISLAVARYCLGVAFVSSAVLRAGASRLVPAAFFYEPLTIVIGVLVLWRVMMNRRVEWGGVGYRR